MIKSKEYLKSDSQKIWVRFYSNAISAGRTADEAEDIARTGLGDFNRQFPKEQK